MAANTIASKQLIQERTQGFLSHLQEQGADMMNEQPKKVRRTQVGISKEEVAALLLKHRMQLMLVTNSSPQLAKERAVYSFFDDALEKSQRFTKKLFQDAQKHCSWHLYAANNISGHLDDQWEQIKGVEKAAKDWGRLPKLPHVDLAKKLRAKKQEALQKSMPLPLEATDIPPLPPSSQLNPPSSSTLPPSTSTPPPAASTLPPSTSALPPTSSAPAPISPTLASRISPPALHEPGSDAASVPPAPVTVMSVVEPQAVADVPGMAKVVRKSLETGEVEVLLSSGSRVWAPLELGPHKDVRARLPDGESLATDINPLLMGCLATLSRKRTASQMKSAQQSLDHMQAAAALVQAILQSKKKTWGMCKICLRLTNICLLQCISGSHTQKVCLPSSLLFQPQHETIILL